ncbi:hypothetical protein OROGR_007068 [Orobanche gracilis]
MPRLYPPGIRKLLRVLPVQWIGNENRFKDLADLKVRLNGGALHVAADAGLTDACKYLVEGLKLDVNAKDSLGFTPLSVAAMKGHTATSKYLLEHGAAIPNDRDFFALHFAAENGDFEVMKFLLEKGVSVDLRNAAVRSTPLTSAARKSREDVVKFLLERGANPNGHPEDIHTPLQTAAAAGSFACSELLIKAGADPNLVYFGCNPLQSAAYDGMVEIINLLLQAGADPDATHMFNYHVLDYQEGGGGGDKSMKPIEIAALQGHNEAVEILFPITKPIDNIKEWSIDGILDEMQLRKKGRKRGQPKSRISNRLRNMYKQE